MNDDFKNSRSLLFADILRRQIPYVDKSNFFPSFYVPSMFNPKFLARPRRFGKTLLLSSLNAFFSGRTNLFEGLGAEEFMKSSVFFPHPVIHLDMSAVKVVTSDTDISSTVLLKSKLINTLDKIAEMNGVSLVNPLFDDRFEELIEILALKSPDSKCVLLIDEYDSPVISLMQKERKLWDLKLIDDMRNIMRQFYSKIKVNEFFLGFTLITGVTKFSKMGVFSELNSLIDLSLRPEYAALCGFTQKELEKYFVPFFSDLAKKNNMDVPTLLEALRNEYDGYSFDGLTRVYNPHSIVMCIESGAINNFWIKSGSNIYLRQFLLDKAAFSIDYDGMRIDNDFASEPGELETTSPEGFLYQAGYLTIRQDDDGGLSLSYPNGEVRKSMSRLSTLAMMDNSVNTVEDYFSDLSKCLGSGDPGLVFQHIRSFFSKTNYQALFAVEYKFNNSPNSEPAVESRKRQPGESTYQTILYKYLYNAGVLVEKEKSGNLGRSDLVVSFLGKIYVIELKMAGGGQDPKDVAKIGLEQIVKKNHGGQYKNPILMSIVLDNNLRNVVACCFAIGRHKGLSLADKSGQIESANLVDANEKKS
ncbi:MAG: ATP-binding protein [Deltaproteobacteria bacterium]|jgi:hypothetical protein|nr:ATP-binding protein [Deltaproteobacteria bacterium]